MKKKNTFDPGIRLSIFDMAVLVLGAAGGVAVGKFDAALGFAVAFTVAYFFLFCNLIRMARPLELVWALLFAVLSSCTVLINIPTWTQTFSAAFLHTLVLVAIQLRSPSYHGIFWKQLNPGLPNWWVLEAKAAGKN